MLSSLPLVSVIIPTYNAEDFVIESIESVLNQNYDNLEVIIIDDCSTDNTQQIITDYFNNRNLPQVKLFFNEVNLGITKNCNKCLAACSGKYVVMHAGDDIMLQNKILTQVNYLEAHPECTISYHNIEVFDSQTNKTLYHYNSFFRNKARSGDVKVLIKYGCICGGCSVTVRRESIPPEGYEERYKDASDWPLWINMLMNGGEIHYIDQVLSRYRRHANNITGNDKAYVIKDPLLFLSNLIVDHPEYASEIMQGFAITIRTLRKRYNYKYYRKFLWLSMKMHFSFISLSVLMINIITFNKVKL